MGAKTEQLGIFTLKTNRNVESDQCKAIINSLGLFGLATMRLYLTVETKTCIYFYFNIVVVFAGSIP